MLKKLGSLLLALVLALTMFGCGSSMEEVGKDVAGLVIEEVLLPALEEDSTPSTEEVTEAEPQAPPQETQESEADQESAEPEEALLPEDGSYTTKEDVALYIYQYGYLPGNFMTKNEARDLGWEGGGLDDYAPGMCIGGDRFGNYEGLLPEADGRTYTECDIDTLGASKRGAKRIVFSNDGLIYYTDDHYESFTLLYGEE